MWKKGTATPYDRARAHSSSAARATRRSGRVLLPGARARRTCSRPCRRCRRWHGRSCRSRDEVEHCAASLLSTLCRVTHFRARRVAGSSARRSRSSRSPYRRIAPRVRRTHVGVHDDDGRHGDRRLHALRAARSNAAARPGIRDTALDALHDGGFSDRGHRAVRRRVRVPHRRPPVTEAEGVHGDTPPANCVWAVLPRAADRQRLDVQRARRR